MPSAVYVVPPIAAFPEVPKNLPLDVVCAYVQYICLRILTRHQCRMSNFRYLIDISVLPPCLAFRKWFWLFGFFFWKEGRKSVELLFTSFCLNRALCVNPPPHNGTLYSENWLSGSLFRIIHHHGTASCIHGRFTSVKLRKKKQKAHDLKEGLALFMKCQ